MTLCIALTVANWITRHECVDALIKILYKGHRPELNIVTSTQMAQYCIKDLIFTAKIYSLVKLCLQTHVNMYVQCK